MYNFFFNFFINFVSLCVRYVYENHMWIGYVPFFNMV
jgi:hypothetical protein